MRSSSCDHGVMIDSILRDCRCALNSGSFQGQDTYAQFGSVTCPADEIPIVQKLIFLGRTM